MKATRITELIHSERQLQQSVVMPAAQSANAKGATGISVAAERTNYTLKEAAVFLNVSTRTVERLIERKLIRRNKALRKILIPRAELENFLIRTL